MQTDQALSRLRQRMQPGVGLHVSITLFLVAFAGAGLIQSMTVIAILCGIAAVLVWIWYVRRRQCARDMIDEAIHSVGAEALAADFDHAQPYEDDLLLGRLMAYDLESRSLLPLTSLRELHIDDARRPKSGSSDRSEPATRIFCVDDTGTRRHLVTLRLHSPLFEPLVAQILTDTPDCALLYDVTDDVAEFAQELCAALCRKHPEAGFIRQHDAGKRHYSLSRTLQPGFTAFG